MRHGKQKGAAPAFQFYVRDFMTGTITMSLAEVGAYSRLLCHQWDAGSVPGGDVAALARAMVCDRSEAETVWPKIQHKFREKKNGIWINSRLEKERKKQAAFRKLQSEKGKKGGRGKAAAKPQLQPNASPDQALHSSPSGSIPPVVPQGGRRPTRRRRIGEVPATDPAAIQQALDTRRRREEMKSSGMSDAEIEAVFDREYDARKAS